MEFKQYVISNMSKSNAQIAKGWIKLNSLDPYTVEKYRHKVRKIKNDNTSYMGGSINTVVPEIKEGVEPLNYLIIGDLHEPYCHKDYLAFNVALYKQFNLNKVIFIGDIIDSHAISYHEHNPNMKSAKDELDEAILKVAAWYKAFPEAVVLNGNHDLLFDRKILTSGLPTQIMKTLGEILNTKDWKYVTEYISGNYYFTHGTKLSPATIKEKALRIQKSVICGHLHSESYIKNISQDLFVSHIGCGVDFSNPAFDYARGTSKEPIMSSLVIYNNQPILIKM